MILLGIPFKIMAWGAEHVLDALFGKPDWYRYTSTTQPTHSFTDCHDGCGCP